MNAAIATSDPRASAAAASVLRSGGNAIDAAVTAALVLYVVEPQSCGVGGDGFLMVYNGNAYPSALDGSGAIPIKLTTENLKADGLDDVPPRGARSVTTPGAIHLLETALQRFGTITFSQALGPAIEFARKGFRVRDSLARASAGAAKALFLDPVLGPLYSPKGRGLTLGTIITNQRLADCLETLSNEGAQALFNGKIGESILRTVQNGGGYLTEFDLANHQTESIEPISIEFCNHTIWQLPQPTQGPAVINALDNIASTSPPDWRDIVQSTRDGMASAGFDPSAVVVNTPPPAKGDTTYLAVVDQNGLVASLITSIFGDFGSQLGVEEIGGPIHNRATTLRMVKKKPVPGKPPHTTIPSLITGPLGFHFALGVAGGVMQPQAQVQLITRMLVEDFAPQQAIDAPRFKVCFGGALALEANHELVEMYPDALNQPAGPEGFGAAQIVGWYKGELHAAADARRGGSAVIVTS